MNDPSELDPLKMRVVASMRDDYGLQHLWHPQITRIGDKWYIYVTADGGNTDDHKMYVLVNPDKSPFDEPFEMAGRLKTDSEDNWAMHGHVFEHRGGLYMIWSGWESRRAYAETQSIYIAKMSDPVTLSGERVRISRPEFEWERQWIQRDGKSQIRYPVFVNEHPTFFCNEQTDKAYIFYSASGGWTSFACIGELSASKDADLLDPLSWAKAPEPAFKEDREAEIYGPSVPYFIPSPDYQNWFLVYAAMDSEQINAPRKPYIQKISFSPEGHPELGAPISRSVRLPKVSSYR